MDIVDSQADIWGEDPAWVKGRGVRQWLGWS
jgi:hypothetical protein